MMRAPRRKAPLTKRESLSMSRKHSRLHDRNFDDIAERFGRNIYGGLKGQIRLAILERDLHPFLHNNLHQSGIAETHLRGPKLHILDAGGGQGNFSLPLAEQGAEQGHTLTLCDISANMLAKAQAVVDEKQLQNVDLHHCDLQSIEQHLHAPADIILCHAVMEWLAEPRQAIDSLLPCLKPGGILSLMFYNRDSIVLKNALRTNYKKILTDDFHGFRGSLTPINPLRSRDVIEWSEAAGMELLVHSGVRVFYDFRLDPNTRDDDADNLLLAELRYSQVEPFRSLGRYIHLVMQRPSS